MPRGSSTRRADMPSHSPTGRAQGMSRKSGCPCLRWSSSNPLGAMPVMPGSRLGRAHPSRSHALLSPRLVDDPGGEPAVHLDDEGPVEAEVANELSLLLGRVYGDPRPVHEPLARVGVHGEIADL